MENKREKIDSAKTNIVIAVLEKLYAEVQKEPVDGNVTSALLQILSVLPMV